MEFFMNLKMFLFLPVFLLLVSLIPLAFSDSESDLEIEIKDWEGELLGPYGLKAIIYQDGNFEYKQIIELEKNPFLITDLEKKAQYRIEIIGDGMVIGEKNFSLEKQKGPLLIQTAPGGSIKFQIMYNDGFSPINNVQINLKSNNEEFSTDFFTNREGKTSKIWLQATRDKQEYYSAEITIDDSISYVYSPIKISPGISSELKIYTPWPKKIESLITVSLFENGEKIKSEEGKKFLINLVKDGQPISQSTLNHRGDAFFSNFIVGKYSFEVFKKNLDDHEVEIFNQVEGLEIQGEYEFWNSKEINITGNEKEFEILHETENFEIEGCNCVAFRLDDVQDYYLNEVQTAVMDTFLQSNTNLTLGIIGSSIGEDEIIFEKVYSNIFNQNNPSGRFEIASHSWDNVPMPNYSFDEQVEILNRTNQKITKVFHVTPNTFIPPLNEFNNSTIDALIENNFTHISYHIAEQDNEKYDFINSTFYEFPATTETAFLDDEINEWIPLEPEAILEDIEDSIKERGYAVVMMHQYEFAESENSELQNQPNKEMIDNLYRLLNSIKEKNIEIVHIGDIDLVSKKASHSNFDK